MTISIARCFFVIVAYLLSYYLASYFGLVFGMIFPNTVAGGSFIPTSTTEWFAGLPVAMAFFVTLSQFILGQKNVWMWICVALIPAVALELFIDALHIYIQSYR